MTPPEATCCGLQKTAPCIWCPIFAGRPDSVGKIENGPSVRTAQEVDADSSLIRFFMRDSGEPESCLFKATRVEAFCAGGSISPRSAGESERKEARLVAIVDERSDDGNAMVTRTNLRAFTASQLLRFLYTPTIQTSHSSILQEATSTKLQHLDDALQPLDSCDGLVKEPSANRRLLYVQVTVNISLPL